MIEVDRAMIEDYHIDLIQMMENAGRCLALTAKLRFLNNKPQDKIVVVMAGTGGNGGGALVAARRLHNWGAKIHVLITKEDNNFTAIPKQQLDSVRKMGINVRFANEKLHLNHLDLILDGVIGYSLKGPPRGTAKTLIEWANQQTAPILALDAPSGLDTTTGTIFEPAIIANATMTLALPKEGLRAKNVKNHVGELYLADISVPPALYKKPALNLEVNNIFAESDIIKLS